jgi:hypothetical protein
MIIVGYEEEETIEFWWDMLKEGKTLTAESCTEVKSLRY